MIPHFLFVLALTVGTTVVGRAADAQTAQTMPQASTIPDTQIAKILLTINDGEIDAAKIAKSHAQNKEVKDFAKMMHDQHESNMKDTKKIAKSSGINPEDNDTAKALMADAKTSNSDLKRQEKSAFDKAYLKQQIMMHEKALATLKDTLVPSAQNAAFKAHLQKTQAAVTAHLAHARELDGKL